jgi:hypothetical protein
MHKSATKCNETICKWCKNKHGASKIIDTFETYQAPVAWGLATPLHLAFVQKHLLFCHFLSLNEFVVTTSMKRSTPSTVAFLPRLGLVYFGIFTPEGCGDMRKFDVYSILSNILKYCSPKILYYNEEFLI